MQVILGYLESHARFQGGLGEKDNDMNKILNPPKYIVVIIWFLILIFIVLMTLTDDTSNVQSAQVIEIAIWPCTIEEDKQVKIDIFEIKKAKPYVCGKILSTYLPLDLRYSLINLQTEKYELFSEYRKFDAYEFSIELPDNLEVGNYEFEIKSGRRHIVTLYFEVIE